MNQNSKSQELIVRFFT